MKTLSARSKFQSFHFSQYLPYTIIRTILPIEHSSRNTIVQQFFERLYIYKCVYIYIYKYFTRILLDKISLVIFLKLWKSLSQGTSLSSCFQGLQLLVFSSTFKNVRQPFHLSNYNNVSQKIFVRPLINSYFCFNLITL